MSQEATEDKVFKIRIVTLITIIGSTVSICVVIAGFVFGIYGRLDKHDYTLEAIKNDIKEIKQVLSKNQK